MPTCSAAAHGSSDYPVKRRNRSEFVTAETELNAMAAPASIGLSKIPKNGYSVPGAAMRATPGNHRRVKAHGMEHRDGGAGAWFQRIRWPGDFCHTITHLATPCLSEDRA
jgi:hypothetical protein